MLIFALSTVASTSWRVLVEAKQEYRNSFHTYCSQDKGSFVLKTKGLLFSSIYVNIVLFLTQRVFCFQVFMYYSQHKGSFILSICVLFLIQRVFCIRHLCQYCIILDTKVFYIKHLCQYCIVLDTKGLLY